MKARTSFLEREALISATEAGFQPHYMVAEGFANSGIVSEFRRSYRRLGATRYALLALSADQSKTSNARIIPHVDSNLRLVI
jgi:tRNA 2-selenouridine synthase SelU